MHGAVCKHLHGNLKFDSDSLGSVTFVKPMPVG